MPSPGPSPHGRAAMNEQVEFMKAQKLAMRLEKLMPGNSNEMIANVIALMLARFASTCPEPQLGLGNVVNRADWFLESASKPKVMQ